MFDLIGDLLANFDFMAFMVLFFLIASLVFDWKSDTVSPMNKELFEGLAVISMIFCAFFFGLLMLPIIL